MDNTKQINNKRVLKNTLFLYCRMFITVIVSLYTSRIMLQYLGVNDYGLRNVVGGIIAVLGFVTNTMANASTRFFSFELGKNKDSLGHTFSVTLTIYIYLIICTFLVLETIGLWFVIYKLNIPDGRFLAAMWVYQFSVLTACVSLIRIPFNASIIANEKMNFYAYVSIIEVALQLLVTYFLIITTFDRLKLIAVLYFLVGVIVTTIYIFYSRRHFAECTFKLSYDKNKFREIFSFAGWNFFSNIGNVALDQGINILLNLFFGTAVNAARGIAYQVRGQVLSLATNFQVAAGPQITKFYAAKDIYNMQRLIFQSSKFSFFLMLILAIPLFVGIDFILEIWLDEVPEYTAVFIRLLMVNILIDCLGGTLNIGIQATAQIRKYSILLTVFKIVSFCIGYFFLKYFDCSPVYSVYITMMYSVMSVILQIVHANALIGIHWYKYVKDVIIFDFLVLIIVSIIVGYIYNYYKSSDVFVTTVSFFVTLLIVYILGLTNKERQVVNRILLKKFR